MANRRLFHVLLLENTTKFSQHFKWLVNYDIEICFVKSLFQHLVTETKKVMLKSWTYKLHSLRCSFIHSVTTQGKLISTEYCRLKHTSTIMYARQETCRKSFWPKSKKTITQKYGVSLSYLFENWAIFRLSVDHLFKNFLEVCQICLNKLQKQLPLTEKFPFYCSFSQSIGDSRWVLFFNAVPNKVFLGNFLEKGVSSNNFWRMVVSESLLADKKLFKKHWNWNEKLLLRNMDSLIKEIETSNEVSPWLPRWKTFNIWKSSAHQNKLVFGHIFEPILQQKLLVSRQNKIDYCFVSFWQDLAN